MEKHLCTSEDEFFDWLERMGSLLNCDTVTYKLYPPIDYPCVLVYKERDIESMRWHCTLDMEYVYKDDFQGA